MFEWLLIKLSLFPTVILNSTTPCFFNETAGVAMFQNCGGGRDWLTMALSGWEWVTGGWFSMIVVAVLVLAVYIKYQKVIYPIVIGIVFLPVSFFLFPSVFLVFGILLGVGVGLGLLISWIFTSQTNEQ